ncbi:uncharacterized protein LOC135366274 [Ornithodoros turicata]|uniref:uncharacterized protein LOC135366274 n=1 Tax=Ornithodoros turicata TaxID=34597 RepID=UPI00313A0DC9
MRFLFPALVVCYIAASAFASEGDNGRDGDQHKLDKHRDILKLISSNITVYLLQRTLDQSYMFFNYTCVRGFFDAVKTAGNDRRANIRFQYKHPRYGTVVGHTAYFKVPEKKNGRNNKPHSLISVNDDVARGSESSSGLVKVKNKTRIPDDEKPRLELLFTDYHDCAIFRHSTRQHDCEMWVSENHLADEKKLFCCKFIFAKECGNTNFRVYNRSECTPFFEKAGTAPVTYYAFQDVPTPYPNTWRAKSKSQ